MKLIPILKYSLLLIAFILSCFFMFHTNKLTDLNLLGIIGGVFLSINILLLNKRNKFNNNKIFKIILIILTILSISIWLLYISIIIKEYINFNTINIRISNIYFTTLIIIIVNDFEDIWKSSNKTYNILTIIVTLLVIIIHYRYYIDNKLLHNLLRIKDINSIILQHSYIYITQYYSLFTIIYIILIINKKINNSINKI